MATLSTSDLIKGVRCGRGLGPAYVADTTLDALIAKIETQRLQLGTDDPLTHRLRHALADQTALLKPDRRALLDAANLYVLPLDTFVAFADAETESIVLSQGALDLTAASIREPIALGLVPDELACVSVLSARHDLDLFGLLTTGSLLRRFHSYRMDAPLPNFAAVLNAELRSHAEVATRGAVLAMILHELGHITEGAHRSDVPATRSFSMVVEQRLNADQREEASADQFVLDSVIDKAAAFPTFWLAQALAFFTSLEQLSGRMDESHPLTTNRIHHASIARKRASDARDYGVEPAESDTALLAQRFSETRQAVQSRRNALLATTREGTDRVLGQCLDILRSEGIDLAPAYEDWQGHWLDDYAEAPEKL